MELFSANNVYRAMSHFMMHNVKNNAQFKIVDSVIPLTNKDAKLVKTIT